jgi:hypothetical protein
VACQAIIAEVVYKPAPLAEQKGLQLMIDCPAETIVVQANLPRTHPDLDQPDHNAIKFTAWKCGSHSDSYWRREGD